MKNNPLAFDFVADKAQNTLTIQRGFAASRQLVWDCYTKSELLEQWFAPKPFTTKTQRMEFREGGHWLYAMVDPNGTEYWGRTDYLSIQPIEKYTALDGFCDENGVINSEMPRATWVVTFQETAGQALVHTVIQYESLADLEKIIQMGMETGLAMALETLDELLEQLQHNN